MEIELGQAKHFTISLVRFLMLSVVIVGNTQ